MNRGPSSAPARAIALFLTLGIAACAPSAAWQRHLMDGERALRHGQYAEAETALLAARADAALFPKNDPRRFQTDASLADLYAARRDLPKAERLLLDLQGRAEALYGPKSLEAAMNLAYLGDLYALQGRENDAEKAYRRALTLAEGMPWGKGLQSTPLRELASLYEAQGRNRAAKQLYEGALESARRTLGPEHPLVAERMNDLAVLCRSMGQAKEAEALYLKALAILRRHPALKALQVGQLDELALFYETQERSVKAEEAYRRALALAERGLKRDDPITLMTVSGLAGLLRRTGRAAQADALERRPRPSPRAKTPRRRP